MFASVATLQVGSAGRHVVAYGLENTDIDAAVSCVMLEDGRFAAALSMHTWQTDDALDARRFDLALELEQVWLGLAEGGAGGGADQRDSTGGTGMWGN